MTEAEMAELEEEFREYPDLLRGLKRLIARHPDISLDEVIEVAKRMAQKPFVQ